MTTPARMSNESSKQQREEACGLEQVTVAPALEQSDRRANQPKDTDAEKLHDSDEKPSIFLSEDIWTRVAMRMTMKEWARISGTCKAMSKVQLPSIILDSSTADAVVWAAKHSRTTEKFSLKLIDWDEQKSAAVSAAIESHVRQLHSLCVQLEPRQDRGTLQSWVVRLVSQRTNQDAGRWMFDMVSRATNARLVYLMGMNLAGPAFASRGFPPLAQVTRLIITTPLPLEVCSSIQQLPALQHLLISKGPGLPEMQALPTLDLTGCTALQKMNLEDVLPSTLVIPQEVELYLNWLNSPAMLEVWMDVCDKCIYLRLMESHSMSGPLGLSWQMDGMFLMPCPKLRVLDLLCKSVGHAGLPLLLDLPSLEHLSIMSCDAYALLSNRTRPKEVHVSVKEELDLVVEDLAAFAAGIDAFYYIEPEILTERTKLLLEYFDDEGLWQKTSEIRKFTHHKICRLYDGEAHHDDELYPVTTQ